MSWSSFVFHELGSSAFHTALPAGLVQCCYQCFMAARTGAKLFYDHRLCFLLLLKANGGFGGVYVVVERYGWLNSRHYCETSCFFSKIVSIFNQVFLTPYPLHKGWFTIYPLRPVASRPNRKSLFFHWARTEE